MTVELKVPFYSTDKELNRISKEIFDNIKYKCKDEFVFIDFDDGMSATQEVKIKFKKNIK